MSRLPAFLAVGLLWCSPVAAAITATNNGQQDSISVSVGSLTVNSSSTGWIAPTAGRFTFVIWNAGSAPTAFTCGDDVAGTTGWTVIPRYVTTGAGAGYMWACWNPNISAGVASITITVTGGTNSSLRMAVAQFTSIAASPRDASGDSPGNSSNTAALTGTDTTGTPPGTLLAQADELLIGYMSDGSGLPPTAFVPGAGWTALTQVPEQSGNFGMRWAWFETSSTAAVTWSPTWAPIAKWGLKIYAFKATSSSVVVCTLTTIGVGGC